MPGPGAYDPKTGIDRIGVYVLSGVQYIKYNPFSYITIEIPGQQHFLHQEDLITMSNLGEEIFPVQVSMSRRITLMGTIVSPNSRTLASEDSAQQQGSSYIINQPSILLDQVTTDLPVILDT